MDYLVLIYADNKSLYALPQDELQQIYEDHAAYGQALVKAGIMRGGSELKPDIARTVVVRGGERLVSDGPLVESREQLCGYYLIECGDDDEAVDWAGRCPGAKYGTIEIRSLEN